MATPPESALLGLFLVMQGTLPPPEKKKHWGCIEREQHLTHTIPAHKFHFVHARPAPPLPPIHAHTHPNTHKHKLRQPQQDGERPSQPTCSKQGCQGANAQGPGAVAKKQVLGCQEAQGMHPPGIQASLEGHMPARLTDFSCLLGEKGPQITPPSPSPGNSLQDEGGSDNSQPPPQINLQGKAR